jgi:hypothetical protein
MPDQIPLIEIIAPCGLNCSKCLAYEKGDIRKHSQAIMELLGPNFDAYVERFANMEPAFQDYPVFKRLLTFLSQGRCGGCRQSGCLFTACGVHPCVKKKGINFCFECPEFPCTRHGLPSAQEGRWKSRNETMRALGLEGYYKKIKDLPRYP